MGTEKVNNGSAWEDKATWFNFLTLGYLTPLLVKGARTPLEPEDVGIPREQDMALACNERFERAWQKELERNPENPSVLWAQMVSAGFDNIGTAVFFYALSAGINFIPVLVLNVIVQYFEGTAYQRLTTTDLTLLTVSLLVFPMIGSMAQTRHDVTMLHAGVQSRTAVAIAVYKHSLRLTSAARQGVSTGEVVNLFSNDALKVEQFMRFFAFIFVAPVQIVVCLWLIYTQVGDAMFVGLGFMIFLIPIQGFIFATLFAMQKKFIRLTDKRVNMMNEVLSGIRVVKFYGWEDAFKTFVREMRNDEIAVLTRMAYVVAVGFSLVLLSAPIIQPVLIFATYAEATGKSLDAAEAFTTIALFNLLRFPFAFLPLGLMQYLNCKVASQRLGAFLTRTVLEDYIDHVANDSEAISEAGRDLIADPDCMLAVHQASFNWGTPEPLQAKSGDANERKRCCPCGPRGVPKQEQHDDNDGDDGVVDTSSGVELQDVSEGDCHGSLRGISVRVKRGDLVAVVGSVGSGKSSLLSALSGEMLLEEGSVAQRTGTTVAFAAQVPWILNKTLKENITFGYDFNEDRYATTLQGCCLEADIAVLPGGDQTEIGEKGINLSGGQKARVALARAVYSDADIYIMDDPLSAVDAHVGKTLFDDCICQVLAGKTRILVTHQLHVLQRCDMIVVMNKGTVEHVGTFEELRDRGVPLTRYQVQEEEEEEEDEGASGKRGDGLHQPPVDALDDTIEIKKRKEEEKIARGSLTEVEERKVGAVSWSAYKYFARAGGWLWVAVAVVFMFGGRACEVAGSFWLATWAKRSLQGDESGDRLSEERTSMYVTGYAMLAMGGVLGLTVRAIAIANHRLRASTVLHSNLVDSILAAPMAFFDITPMGRVLNRFAADIQTIDVEISHSVSQIASCITNVTGALAAISAATRGTFVLLLLPLSFIYYTVQSLFRATSTEVERLSKISRSPIFADFSQTLTGAASIRAYDAQTRFIASASKAMDLNNACVLVVQLCFSWLSFRLDLLGAIVSFFIVGLAVVTRDSNFIPAGWVGLSLAFAIELTSFLKHFVRVMATAEGQLASVERIMTYTHDIDSETSVVVPHQKQQRPSNKLEITDGQAAAADEGEAVSEHWPEQGAIDFDGVVMGYRKGPDVLKGLSFSVKPREKIGIVGRTGSGKSSVLVTLFRIVELREGSIRIDGVDLSRVPLSVLRRRLSIIPQDPVMFSSTVRFNLDPFALHSDADLWSVLDKVQLAGEIKDLPNKLEEPVSEGGENFSVGQRQLICIARAMLRRPHVLVLDEATASIDNETDAIIQRMIREEFREVTVLTIAHRLHTIIDSDRIVVLQDGVVCEFDTPSKLLEDSSGVFKAMVDAAQSKTESTD